jgi:hypothetical protein
MMSERTSLITARRQSEDNLVRTIIQLSSALIAVMAGFLSQSKTLIAGSSSLLLETALLSLGLAIASGLTEHFFSSKASEEQQLLVEQFYQKVIHEFGAAPSNRWVRLSQLSAFIFFLIGLASLGLLAFRQVGDEYVQGQRVAPVSSSAAKAAGGSGQARSGQVGSAEHAPPPPPEK